MKLPGFRHSRALGLCTWTAATVAIPALAGWIPIGPRGDIGSAVGQFVIGRVAAIQIVARLGGGYYVYMGASSGGIWRTDPTDQPLLWSDLGQNLPHPSVGAIGVHPNDPNDILVGTGDSGREYDGATGFSGGAGMFHTTDGGAHWAKVIPSSLLNVPPPATFFRILYQPGSLDVVLAASSSGLFRSERGPNGPWQQVLNGSVSDLIAHPSATNTMFACDDAGGPQGNGLYASFDAGRTWNLILSVNQAQRGAVAICRSNPSILWSVWESGGNILAVLKSTDGGTNWSSVAGLNGGGAGAADAALAVAIAPADANQVYVGSSDLWRTFDGGATWETVGGSVTTPEAIKQHDDNTQLYFSPLNNNTLWICNDGGVYAYLLGQDKSVSYNGDNRAGLQISQIYNLDARRNLRFIAMQDIEIAGSTDGGATWKSFHPERNFVIDGGKTLITAADDQNPAFWFISGSGGSRYCVYRGTQNGSPTQIICPDPNPKYASLFYDRFTDRVFAVTPATQVISYPSQANGAGDGQPEASATAGAEGISGSYLDGQTLYLWVKNLNVVPGPSKFNLLVLRRSGPGWTVTTRLIGTTGETNPVMQVVASRKWSGETWAALGGAPGDAKVFHSTDYGDTWSNISGDLATNIGGVNTLAASPFDSKELYIGTGTAGVFRTLDGGGHWERFQDGLPLVSVTDMLYLVDESQTGTDKLVISTYGRGLYERALDRPGPVYVDQLRSFLPPWLGTIEFPLPTLDWGINATPSGGYLLLNGSLVYSGSRTLTKPMTISAYDFPARLGQ